MALISDPMNLGPLTTVFTAPLACSTDALYVNNNRDCAGSVSVLRGPVDTSSGGRCFPPGFDSRAGAYYSPGLCPLGYTVACTSILADNTAASELAETVLTCCPQAAQGLTYGCSAGPEWSWGGCHATLGGATATLTGATTVECGTTRDAGPDFIWDGVAQAQSVQVRFRAGDESLFETGHDTAPTTTTTTTTPAASSDRATPAAGNTEPAARASDGVLESTAGGAGSPPAAHKALVAVAASCGTIMTLALAVAALLFVRARRVARELRDREQQLNDRFYHAAKPRHGGGDDPGNENSAAVVTVTALGMTPTAMPTTSPAPVVVAPAPPAPPTPAFAAARPLDVSPLSVAGARLADHGAALPAELGTAPQYEMEGTPVVRPQRGRQAPFPPPVQKESPTVEKAVTTQEFSPVSEPESPA